MKIEERAEEIRRKRINVKYKEIKKWVSSIGLPTDLKKEIREYCKQNAIAEHYIDTPVDVEFLDRARNDGVKRSILKYFFLNAAKKVGVSTQCCPNLFQFDFSYLSIW